jgi:hypothetical protein
LESASFQRFYDCRLAAAGSAGDEVFSHMLTIAKRPLLEEPFWHHHGWS